MLIVLNVSLCSLLSCFSLLVGTSRGRADPLRRLSAVCSHTKHHVTLKQLHTLISSSFPSIFLCCHILRADSHLFKDPTLKYERIWLPRQTAITVLISSVVSKLADFMSTVHIPIFLKPSQFKKPTNVNYAAHCKVRALQDFTVAAGSCVLV